MISRLIAVLLAFISAPRLVRSCDCGPQPPPLKALAQVGTVFSGKVTGIEEKEAVLRQNGGPPFHVGTEVRIEVMKSWKGKVGKTAVVFTGSGGGDCGFPFEVGRKYLIYAFRVDKTHWATSVCSRTNWLEDAATEILELDGRLPKLNTPPQGPVFELRGGTVAAKSGGGQRKEYIFTLRNRLHQRIFYFGNLFPLYLIQTKENGKWVDQPRLAEELAPWLSPEDAKARIPDWGKFYKTIAVAEWMTYLDRVDHVGIFVKPPAVQTPWRVGFQYVTERELDAGVRIQKSKHYVWSAPIDGETPIKELSYEEATAREKAN